MTFADEFAPISEFLYTPLQNPEKNLRLLEIKSGADEDGLVCTLTTWYTAENLKYEALSYTWGENTGSVPILLNEKLFFVTPNLYSALRNLRNRTWVATQGIWIDAI